MSAVLPPIVVDVLTGFLGAGKTTYLRRLLDAGALADTAILVNEFADLPVDQRLVGATGSLTAVLAGGCLCCAIDGDLKEGLLGLIQQRADGTVPPFARILVETSGIADPAPVAGTILGDRQLQARLRFGGTVTVVDLLNVAETLATQEEALAQIIAADRIVLSKGDLVDDARRAEAVAAIGAINPLAPIVDAEPRPGERLNPWRTIGWTTPTAPRRAAFQAVAQAGDRHNGLGALVLTWPEPVDWAVFATWLSALLHRHGARILRVKGLMRIAGETERGPVVIQGVRHVVYAPEHLADADDVVGAEFVMIVRDLDPALIRRSFEAFMALGQRAGETQRGARAS
ncbi:GTP-binding protein [Kaistia dalseonensis]|uniref:G3E family GTPase n=1 Tax=Kaistia dalseonensis TaxID=410840 RepID=A0ABU0H3R2_9HYPH|nr:GTP-binding protein [Kaistia dalseonensis]MCX5494358.1 GTP-binding protein [Kaistia dalseonensis]MDQ0436940.1 G3E family GTPase [Kaistia dalseonensis]